MTEVKKQEKEVIYFRIDTQISPKGESVMGVYGSYITKDGKEVVTFIPFKDKDDKTKITNKQKRYTIMAIDYKINELAKNN